MFVYASGDNKRMDTDALIADCMTAVADSEPRRAIRGVLERAISDRKLTAPLSERPPGIELLHNTDELTVINVIWPPGIKLLAHEHRMWAAIGIYGGYEDNMFFRRDASAIVESGGKRLAEGDVLLLGDDAIHSVTNPERTYTGAIHVYGGDFVRQPRSQWSRESHAEEPYDFDAFQAEFDKAERDFRAESY
jgi:predicted metal-dependent enzyme (double-stranded beta helix superfamily)